MKIKATLFWGLVSLSFSSFGMNYDGAIITAEEYRERFKIEPPELGKPFDKIDSLKAGEPFYDRIVVYSQGEPKGNEVIFYGCLNKYKESFGFNRVVLEKNESGGLIFAPRQALKEPVLTEHQFTHGGHYMRLLTRNEMRYLAAQEQLFNVYNKSVSTSVLKKIKTLGNLLPAERRRVIHDSKNIITLRLIHKLRKGSLLGLLPKDIINLIIKQLIELELHNEDLELDLGSCDKK